MPPPRVGASGNQTNDDRAPLGGLAGFAHPACNNPAVGWVHEDNMPAPVLCQAVLFSGEEPLALCIFRRGTWIESEMEFSIERVVQPLRRGPFGIVRGEVNRERCPTDHRLIHRLTFFSSEPAKCRAPLPEFPPDTPPADEAAYACGPASMTNHHLSNRTISCEGFHPCCEKGAASTKAYAINASEISSFLSFRIV